MIRLALEAGALPDRKTAFTEDMPQVLVHPTSISHGFAEPARAKARSGFS